MADKVKEAKQKISSEQLSKLVKTKTIIYKASKIAFNVVCFLSAVVFFICGIANKDSSSVIVCFSILLVHSIVKCFDFFFDNRIDRGLWSLGTTIYSVPTCICSILAVSGIWQDARFLLIVFLLVSYSMYYYPTHDANIYNIPLHDFSNGENVVRICELMLFVILSLLILPIIEICLVCKYNEDDERKRICSESSDYDECVNSLKPSNEKQTEKDEIESNVESETKHADLADKTANKNQLVHKYKLQPEEQERIKESLRYRKYKKRESFAEEINYNPDSVKWVSEKYNYQQDDDYNEE